MSNKNFILACRNSLDFIIQRKLQSYHKIQHKIMKIWGSIFDPFFAQFLAQNLNKKNVFLELQKSSFFVPIFFSFFAKIFCFFKGFLIEFFFIFMFPKLKYEATINSQVKNFFFFFWNFLSNDNQNVDLKYQNLKEGEHFYFIENQQNSASFFIKNCSHKIFKTGPPLFSQAR